jgi:hypothetical protein
LLELERQDVEYILNKFGEATAETSEIPWKPMRDLILEYWVVLSSAGDGRTNSMLDLLEAPIGSDAIRHL